MFMYILAIDASTKSSGWSVFKDEQLVDYGCIQSASTDLIKRIYIMKNGLEEVLNNQSKVCRILKRIRLYYIYRRQSLSLSMKNSTKLK